MRAGSGVMSQAWRVSSFVVFYVHFNSTTNDGHATSSLVPWKGRKPWKYSGFGPPEPSDQNAAENKDSVSPAEGPGLFVQVSGNPLTLLDMMGTRVSFMFGW